MIRSIKLGLAALFLASATLFIAAPASAQTPVTCANAPTGLVTGNLIIVDTSAACNIPYSISATQNISIQATGPITITGSVTMPEPTSTTYGSIYINGQQSVKITGAVSAKPTTISSPGGGSIVIDAGGTLQAGAITTSLGGYIVLESQKAGGTQPFVVGTSGENGVGKLSTSGTNNGVYNYTLQASTLVYVSNGNGTASATGGITVTATSSIAIANGGGGRAGGLILNAENGPLSIPGSITLAGTTNLVGGGYLTFLANSVTFTTTTTLNVSQNTSVNATCYNTQIAISAATINYTTLTLNGNGIGAPAGCGNDGSSTTYPAGVFLESQNQLAIADTQTVVDNILSVLTIYVNPTGNPLSSLTMTGTGALSVTANGNTAQAVIRAYPFSIAKGTTVSLSSTGSTDHGVYISNETVGSGQEGITLGNTGTVTLNASGLITAGATTTAGGFIYVAGDQVALNASTFVINANGPSGAGDGGIAYLSSTLLSTGSAFKGAKITANASTAGAGNAQNNLIVPALSPTTQYPAITLNPGSAPALTLGNGTSGATFNLAANGGDKGGNAGTVLVDGYTTTITINSALAVNASALDASVAGNGGTIQINGLITSLTDTATIHAVGEDSGLGGTVTINNTATTPLDVNLLVDVDGGKSIASSAFDGLISVNLVACQQYLTSTSSNTTFPVTYWNCVNTTPNTPTSLDMAPSQVAISALSTALRAKGNDRIYLYVFVNQSNFLTYFSQTAQATNSGATWHPSVPTKYNVYSSVWETNPATGNTFSQSTLSEITIHELGHAFDYVIGQNTQSGSTKYNQYVQNDFFTLNYAIGGTAKAPTYTPVDPCLPAGTVAAPFANITDQNGYYICENATGTGPGTILNSLYAGMTNTQILVNANVGKYWFTTYLNDFGVYGWAELYAQALAYNAYAATSGQPFAYVVPDNIFKNGYFGCTQAWAGAIKAGSTTPPTNTKCSGAVPTP